MSMLTMGYLAWGLALISLMGFLRGASLNKIAGIDHEA